MESAHPLSGHRARTCLSVTHPRALLSLRSHQTQADGSKSHKFRIPLLWDRSLLLSDLPLLALFGKDADV